MDLNIPFSHLLEETGFIAGVANRAVRGTFNQDGIVIAVYPYFFYVDKIPRGGSLMP